MKVKLMQVGEIYTNCYIVESDKKNAIIIDPGEDGDKILDFCKKEDITIKYILLTHGHYDHIGGITKIKNATDAKVYINENDEEILLNPDLLGVGRLQRLKDYKPQKADFYLNENDEIILDDIKIKVILTPGHSKGSCVFICGDIIFTGDTIFQGSIGRVDLYGGNGTQIIASIGKITSLKDDYTLLCGHGDKTKLSLEKATNPFMVAGYEDIF